MQSAQFHMIPVYIIRCLLLALFTWITVHICEDYVQSLHFTVITVDIVERVYGLYTVCDHIRVCGVCSVNSKYCTYCKLCIVYE